MDESWSREFGELDASDELRESIKPELEPGERLLWASRPGPRALKKSQGGYLGIVVWAIGMLILCVICLTGGLFGGRRFETLSGILLFFGVCCGVVSFLIVIGILSTLASGRPIRSSLTNQVYAISDQRVIWKTTDPKTQAVTINSFHRGTIKPEHLHRIQYPDGSGDVLFHESFHQPTGFLDVADVRRVEGLIRRFLIASDPGSTP